MQDFKNFFNFHSVYNPKSCPFGLKHSTSSVLRAPNAKLKVLSPGFELSKSNQHGESYKLYFTALRKKKM